MPSKIAQTGIRLTADLVAKLEFLKQRDGIPYSEQMRRALTLWFETKDLPVRLKTARQRTKKVTRG